MRDEAEGPLLSHDHEPVVPQQSISKLALVGEVRQFADPADRDFQTTDAGGLDAH